MTNKTPTISINLDAEKDIELFCRFLESEKYPQKRAAILYFYKGLAKKIEQGREEKEAVRDILSDLYSRYDPKLKEIVGRAGMDFSGAGPVFDALSQYMEFPQLGEQTYSATPTLLPFSPLGNMRFFFSVAPVVANREIPPLHIAAIGIHEISHFIFFKQLEDWSKATGNSLNDAAIHYFKEALTPAVMNQKEFLDFFDYAKVFPGSSSLGKYRGNKEVQSLMVENGGVVKNIVDLFEEEIVCAPEGYLVGLNKMLGLFADSNEELAGKWNLWNKTKAKQEKNDAGMEDYKKPILMHR
ncbi:MAG: hypothetical protein P4L81_03945 [Candidatus Pacebacteria bacterium]|nr:hypothetical protein [Candidatus Paceibacterota bacterium]